MSEKFWKESDQTVFLNPDSNMLCYRPDSERRSDHCFEKSHQTVFLNPHGHIIGEGTDGCDLETSVMRVFRCSRRFLGRRRFLSSRLCGVGFPLGRLRFVIFLVPGMLRRGRDYFNQFRKIPATCAPELNTSHLLLYLFLGQ